VKILFLDQFSELGGAQQSLLDTIEAVRRKGWRASALLPGRGPLVETLQAIGVPVGEIACGPYESGTKSPGDSVRFVLDLGSQVRSIRSVADVDLIYVNGPRLMPAAALASGKRKPIVFHAHSHVYGIAAQLLRRGIRRADATVIACSNSVLDPLRDAVGACSVNVIPSGVRDAGYRERRFEDGNWRMGIVGRIAPDKGQLEFAGAARILARALPGARFVICGALLFGASSAYLDEVQEQSRGLPMDFLPWQSDIGRVLSDLDLLVVPSKREGMARIIAEAFSAGVPVVAFPAGGIPEAIVDGETGFLTRDFSANGLACRIREATANTDVLHLVTRNARNAWARLYTVSAYQERIICLIERLLEQHVPETSRQVSPTTSKTPEPQLRR
jgi:glycosyltransferase involved in cell wall biosynthesis